MLDYFVACQISTGLYFCSWAFPLCSNSWSHQSSVCLSWMDLRCSSLQQLERQRAMARVKRMYGGASSLSNIKYTQLWLWQDVGGRQEIGVPAAPEDGKEKTSRSPRGDGSTLHWQCCLAWGFWCFWLASLGNSRSSLSLRKGTDPYSTERRKTGIC